MADRPTALLRGAVSELLGDGKVRGLLSRNPRATLSAKLLSRKCAEWACHVIIEEDKAYMSQFDGSCRSTASTASGDGSVCSRDSLLPPESFLFPLPLPVTGLVTGFLSFWDCVGLMLLKRSMDQVLAVRAHWDPPPAPTLGVRILPGTPLPVRLRIAPKGFACTDGGSYLSDASCLAFEETAFIHDKFLREALKEGSRDQEGDDDYIGAEWDEAISGASAGYPA